MLELITDIGCSSMQSLRPSKSSYFQGVKATLIRAGKEKTTTGMQRRKGGEIYAAVLLLPSHAAVYVLPRHFSDTPPPVNNQPSFNEAQQLYLEANLDLGFATQNKSIWFDGIFFFHFVLNILETSDFFFFLVKGKGSIFH